jgi:hypothetical protein
MMMHAPLGSDSVTGADRARMFLGREQRERRLFHEP